MMTTTGAIDTMAEEIIKPMQPYRSPKAPFLAAKPSTASQERSRVTQEGREHHVTSSKTSGPATIAASIEGDSGSRKSGGGGDDGSSRLVTDKHLPGDLSPKAHQQRKENRTGKGVGDSELRTRLGKPPKLPPKPPGLLEKIKDGSHPGACKVKPKSPGQEVHVRPTKPTVSPKVQKKKVQNTVSHPGSVSSTGSESTREIHAGNRGGTPSNRTPGNASPNSSPRRSPLTVTKSAQPAMQSPSAKDSHDGIQRTISSPTGVLANSENQKMTFDTQHSTDRSDKEPVVRSRVHELQENLLHVSHEHGPVRQKKLSVNDHHIKVRERAAVFEKIVQGISEKTSVVSLDVDAGGPRKRCARKGEGQSQSPTGGKSDGDLEERINPESISVTSSSPPIQPLLSRTHNLHPVPRPRSSVAVIAEAEEPKPLSAPPNRPVPVPKPRIKSNQTENTSSVPIQALTASAPSAANSTTDLYDEIREFAPSGDVTATLAHDAEKQTVAAEAISTSSHSDAQELELTENIYEDTLVRLPSTDSGDEPRPPPDSVIPDITCRSSLGDARGPHADSSLAAEEVKPADESGTRERQSLYEVYLPVTIAANHEGGTDGAQGTTADTTKSDSHGNGREMPCDQRAGDLITTLNDDEDAASLGNQKLSRQRRKKKKAFIRCFSSLQRHFAVKMRSVEGSGFQRRNGEVKRQGRSLQDSSIVRQEEKGEGEEEEGQNAIYDVAKPDSSLGPYMSGSDGNEYEEVPSLHSSDEEQEKGREEKDQHASVVELEEEEEEEEEKEDEGGVSEESNLAESCDNADDVNEEERDMVPAFESDGYVRVRAKTSPESVRAAAGKKKKRYSEGAFEDFVPIFLVNKPPPSEERDEVDEIKSDGSGRLGASASIRPKSEGGIVMEDIQSIRAGLAKMKEEAEKVEEPTAAVEYQVLSNSDEDQQDSYCYVTEFDLDNDDMSSGESSDYEEVCADGQTLQRSKRTSSKTSAAVFDLEQHRRTLEREDSEASSIAANDYLMLYDDWKAIEESGLLARRNKGSNERKERRKVFATDSSTSDVNMTQGSVESQDQIDSQMTDEAGVYGSCDQPTSPDAHSNGHPMLKKSGVLLPGLEVTTSKTQSEDIAPPLPQRKKSDENITIPSSKFVRKPSRFVAKEPLFQIYQADLRERDSKVNLRPRVARRSKKPPLPDRTFLQNRNLMPRKQLLPTTNNKPAPPSAPPPPLPARNTSNLSTISNISNSSHLSSNISQSSTVSSEVRSSLQKELFSKMNSSSHTPTPSSLNNENLTPLNNNIRSGESHKIMDNSRTCSGNGVVIRISGESENGNSTIESSQMDEMEEPIYMCGNDEGSSSLMSCEDEAMDRNRTHGSSIETHSSQQSSAEGGIDDEEGIYQSGLGDPTYQAGIEDTTYQSSTMDDPMHQTGMGEPTYLAGQEDDEDDIYDVFDDDFDDDDEYYRPPVREGPVREGSITLRSFWCELPEVVSSGLLQNLTPEEKKMQEALFEIITSEASYLRSLSLVVNHFAEAPTLSPPHGVLKRSDHHSLFSNIKTVRDNSEGLLLDLEQHQQESILLSDVCRILLNHLRKPRVEQGFVTYCANNQYQVKALDQFKTNPAFMAELRELESHPECCSLDLLSFLMLPFQRITRLPLLLEAVICRAPEGSDMMRNAVDALTEVRRTAEKCNEEAKRMEMIEEVTLLASMLDFKQGIKKMDISQTSTIVKRGTVDNIVTQANILGGRKKPIAKPIHCIVFTDKVLLAKEKMKGDQKRYEVVDWCPRNLVQITPIDQPSMCSKLPDGVPPDCRNIFTLNMLQNNQRKTNEFFINTKSLSERQRWMDALCPPSQTEDGERIYESWDCPQVICTTQYEANDRDELNLDVSDRVDVYKKVEGWYEGMRVGSRDRGWFPASCVKEIVNDHVRARNLKKRHKILSMCEEQIRMALKPKAK